VVDAAGEAVMEMDTEVGLVWWRECRGPKRTSVASRVVGVGRALAALVRKWALDPAFEARDCSGRKRWNRAPRRPVDVAGWRRAQAEHEPGASPVLLAREQAAVADRRLVAWVRDHRCLGRRMTVSLRWR